MKTFAEKVVRKARKENVVKRKHVVSDSDIDFKNLKKKGKASVTKELKNEQPFEEFLDIKLRMRCSPVNLWETIQSLTEEQQACVREMGFGSILQMNIKSIPTALGYWLLVNYNHHLNELNVGDHVIKITPSLVHEILGIPMGNIKVLQDWCSYVIDNLKSTKEGWGGENAQYGGPITFLVVLYTHEYQKRHGALGDPIQTPAINYITTDSLWTMQADLYDNGPLTQMHCCNLIKKMKLFCTENIERNENEELNVDNLNEKQGEPSFENEERDNNQSGDNENDESDWIDDEPIANLLPKSIKLTHVDFSPEERSFYQKLDVESRSQFKTYADASTVSENYENILLMLLRLRQACGHPLLVKGFTKESISGSSRMAKNLPKYMQSYLLKYFGNSQHMLLVCRDIPEDAVVTLCGHVFCYQCVSDFLTSDDNTCPSPKCKSPIGPDVVFNKTTLRNSISDDNGLQQDYTSSKIKVAVEIIQKNCRSKGSGVKELPVKAIVFSHWTKMLDLLEMALDQNHIEYRRLDGSMSLSSRDHAVNQFNNDPEVRVMLMSLKANNLDLNKLAASHVILLDLWWNPTTEDQAINRISQTRPVTVSRLAVKDTVEDKIFKLQDEKRKMVDSAFGKNRNGTSTDRLTTEDLIYLFMGAH
ncbi:helicase-like transcription factor CHR28 [Bidens hawaiensis]|uniref:helicase-like transcription factor CHR28 n=1 Tax=Bidens hawaiensis TaxID=980011 RepID=UPI00404B7EAB